MINKSWLVIGVLIVLGIVFRDQVMSFGLSEDVHKLRKAGECRECHLDQDYVSEVDYDFNALIVPAKYHTEQFRQFSHGRGEDAAPHQCSSCHEAETCISCHETRPASHTDDFIAPQGQGAMEHALYARLSPSSCLTCHKTFEATCSDCHTQEEQQQWILKAEPIARKWFDLTR